MDRTKNFKHDETLEAAISNATDLISQCHKDKVSFVLVAFERSKEGDDFYNGTGRASELERLKISFHSLESLFDEGHHELGVVLAIIADIIDRSENDEPELANVAPQGSA